MAVGRTLSRGLGVVSLGLGAAQLIAPRRLLRAAGYPSDGRSPLVVRAIGIRELGAAGGLLAQRWPVAFTWMRVAGDAVDIAVMTRALRARGVRRDRATAALGAVAAVSAADLLTGVIVSREAPRQRDDALGGRKPVRKSITINRGRDEVYGYWRALENLPRFMKHLEEVRDTGNGRSHWVAKGPVGTKAAWDAEITEDRPGERIAWQAIPGSGIQNAGTVTFREAPGGRGTEVLVELVYEPPAGPLGIAAAKLLGEEPEQQTAGDLRRLKQVLETGEVVLSEATVGGRSVRQRPAQPVEDAAAAAGTATDGATHGAATGSDGANGNGHDAMPARDTAPVTAA
jgi:uncharacterized membrane protein